jgi:hypothetical protein
MSDRETMEKNAISVKGASDWGMLLEATIDVVVATTPTKRNNSERTESC